MRLKLFGDAAEAPLQLSILNGGYDAETGRMWFIVRNEQSSGVLSFDVSESRQMNASFNVNVPNVERVEPSNVIDAMRLSSVNRSAPGKQGPDV